MAGSGPLLDAHGRPYQGAERGERGGRSGVHRTEDGGLKIDAEAWEQIRRDRERRATMTRVPSMPNGMMRDVGGTVRKGMGRWDSLDFRTLRNLRERSPILQVIHQARQYQIRRLVRPYSGRRGDVGYRVVHRDHTNIGATPPAGFEKWIEVGERYLTRPSPTYCPSFVDAVVSLEEDLLTINRPVVEPLHSLMDPRKLAGWRPVDGAIVLPTYAFLEKWLAKNVTWARGRDVSRMSQTEALDLISMAIGHDVSTAAWAVVRDGSVEAMFRADELIVAPLVNRTDVERAGYPPSVVEQAIELVVAFMNTWRYNTGFFTSGWMPEFLLGIRGDYSDPDIDAVADMLVENAIGVRNAHRPLVIPLPEQGGLEKIDLKPNNTEMQFEVWTSVMTSLCTAIYRMDTSVVNTRPWSGGRGGGLSEPSRLNEIELANEDGLQGDVGHLTTHVFDPMLARIHPDLRLIWEWGDYDPMKEAQVYEVQARVSTTRNEVRLVQGLTPKGFWVPDDEYDGLSDEDRQKYDDNPWNMPSDSAFANLLTQRAQMAQQEKFMAAYGGPPPGGGAPGQDGQPPGGGGPPGGPGGPGQGQEDDPFGSPPDDYPWGQMPAGAAKGAAMGKAIRKAREDRERGAQGPATTIRIFDRTR